AGSSRRNLSQTTRPGAMRQPIVVAFAAAFGALVGSFLNVVVYRVPKGLSIVRPPSACVSCGAHIKSLDNVPILSFLWLRARCRHCGERISARYPLVEAATAGLGAASSARFGLSASGAFVFLGGCVLIVLA